MADERKKGRPAPRVGRNGGTGARGDASQPRGERGRADRGARTDPHAISATNGAAEEPAGFETADRSGLADPARPIRRPIRMSPAASSTTTFGPSSAL